MSFVYRFLLIFASNCQFKLNNTPLDIFPYSGIMDIELADIACFRHISINFERLVFNMSAEFIVETSARHVHVTQEALEILFGKGATLTKKKDLSQPGQFASEQKVEVVGPKKSLANVSILGPVRSANQVELSATDARSIGIVAPIRESGDVAGSGACKLVGPCGEVELSEGVIVAKRHIHLTPADAEELGVKDKEIVWVKVDTDGRKAILGDVVCRVSDKFARAMHIDTDEANAISAHPGLTGTIYKM